MKPVFRTPLEIEIKKGQFVLTFAILLTCGVGFFANNYIGKKKNVAQIVASTAYILTQNLATPLIFQDQKEAIRALGSIKNHPVLKAGVVHDLKGQTFASFPENASEFLKVEQQFTYEYPIMASGERAGVLVLVVRNEIDYAALLGYGMVVIIVLGVGFIVGLIFKGLTTSKIIGEITSLLAVIRTITRTGNYSPSALQDSKDKLQIEEIFALAAEFDLMLAVIEKNNQKINDIKQGLEAAVENKTRELKEAQAGLIQSSKMSALGEMSAGLAHEINNPLTIIKGKSQQLIKFISEGRLEPELLRKNAELIGTTCGRISKIIKGLRSFSRDGSQDPFEICKLQTIVDDALELCRERFESNHVAIEVIPFDPKDTISCRATELGQVLLNLLNNAHDAVVSLDQKWVRVEVLQHHDWITLSVTDSGNGIPEAIQRKIMQPFFTTKDVGKGTGLGLSISKGIVESHGGKLTIDSQCPNTRFIISLPRQQGPEATANIKVA